jgi:general secretion pathway protein A
VYLDYWQLDARPFEPACEAPFLYAGAALKISLRKLRYAVESRRAACVVAGPAGVGKTLLVDALAEELGDACRPLARVVFPHMTDRDLLAYLAERLGAPPADPPRHTIDESLRRLEFVLDQAAQDGRRPLVVVDEAHLLEGGGLIEPLRLLLNLTVNGRPGLTLLLAGQPSLLSMVARHGALDERVDIKVFLPALGAEETRAYVEHRLTAAGATREIFSTAALAAVHQLTGGVARRINRLCDLALVVGFANGARAIEPHDLHAVHDELIAVTPLAA